MQAPTKFAKLEESTAEASTGAAVAGNPETPTLLNDGRMSRSEKRKAERALQRAADEAKHLVGLAGAATSKRARKPVHRFEEAESMDRDEATALRIALALSRRQTSAAVSQEDAAQEAPVFRPTREQWADPYAYIASIRHDAEGCGICKVVPPDGWCPPDTWPQRAVSNAIYNTRLQTIHRLGEGLPFPDGKSYTAAKYRAMADEYKRQWYVSSVGRLRIALQARKLVPCFSAPCASDDY